jgi:DNA primase
MKNREDIVEVIGSYIPLIKKGRSYICECPFHQEKKKSPSMAISKEKQIYTCFVCGAMGNVDTFIKNYFIK